MLTAQVTDISHKGLGVIEHSDGRKLFIDGVVPGDLIEYQVLQLKKSYGFAKLIKVLEASSDRVHPLCSYHGFDHGSCGGCSWMMIDYKKQLKLKQELVLNQMQRVGLKALAINDIKASPQIYGYRNRAQVKTNGVDLGFVSKSSKELCDIKQCRVLNDSCNQQIEFLRSKLPNTSWVPKHRFKWSFFDLDDRKDFENLVPNKRESFRQANSDQNEFMKNWLKTKINTFTNKNLIELFCGSGNFTQVLLKYNSISAYEYSEEAINELKNKFPAVQAESINLFNKESLINIARKNKNAEVLILDPPREGFKDMGYFVNLLNDLKAIIYISCDPSSWASDLKPLNENWRLEEVQPVDQFPHTAHVEVLSLLTKKIT